MITLVGYVDSLFLEVCKLLSCCHFYILYYELESVSSPVLKNVVAAAAKSRQSCPTLWDAIDGSPPGSSVPGILQARALEWVKSGVGCVLNDLLDGVYVRCFAK